MSRTLSSLREEEVAALVQALGRVEWPLIQSELGLLRAGRQRIGYDGDLTGLPVSDSSTTYPQAAFGHLGAEVQLGYQAAVVSLTSPTYGRRVFYLHRIKVRSAPAIYLQARMVIFAANFIRWAMRRFAEHTEPAAEQLDVLHMGVKQQVRVGAHIAARVIQESQGKVLGFSKQRAFAGKVLKVNTHRDGRPPDRESCHSMPFSSESHMIAQPFG